jgi:hypothetical protein
MCVCLSVCPPLHLNSGHFRAEPITFVIKMTRRGSTGHSFSRKLNSGQIAEEKATPTMLFYGEILCHRVNSQIEIDGDRVT